MIVPLTNIVSNSGHYSIYLEFLIFDYQPFSYGMDIGKGIFKYFEKFN